jgi:curli biogenesis system outer membrane secretion channel CsgG
MDQKGYHVAADVRMVNVNTGEKVKYEEVGKVKLMSVEASYSEGKAISESEFQVGDEIK